MITKRSRSETELVESNELYVAGYSTWLCRFASAEDGALIPSINDNGEPVGAHDSVRRKGLSLPFSVGMPVVAKHLKNFFESASLDAPATASEMEIVRAEVP